MLNFDWLAGVPMNIANNIFLIMFALIGLAVLFVPKDSMYEGLHQIRWYHNLKIWAIGDLLLIAWVYSIF